MEVSQNATLGRGLLWPRVGLEGFEFKSKSPRAAGFFSFSILSSEYQVQRDLLPVFGGNFGGEVLMYQGLLLSSGRPGLDTFSTKGRNRS